MARAPCFSWDKDEGRGDASGGVECAGRPAQATKATRGPAHPAHLVRMMQDWSWEGKALRC
jgi:hypothetical protein